MSKRKRSKRSHPDTDSSNHLNDENSTEEENLASCLIMLARGVTEKSEFVKQITNLNLSYKCSVCNKAFNSYQALGGHKTIHRQKNQSPEIDSSSSAVNVAVMPQAGRAHECTICRMSFPTGQALGGHKRRHYDGGNSGVGSGSSVKFDLNMPGDVIRDESQRQEKSTRDY